MMYIYALRYITSIAMMKNRSCMRKDSGLAHCKEPVADVLNNAVLCSQILRS